MKDIICPLDGKPCEKDCPDRYIDHPGGGCFLTTAQELGAKIIDNQALAIVKQLERIADVLESIEEVLAAGGGSNG